MRRIVAMMSVSVDGFFEGPNHELDWSVVDTELHQHFSELLSSVGGLWEGRVTYQLMADFWPTADADPDATKETVQFANIWRDIPKVVYSRTLEKAGWNTSVVHEVDPAQVRAHKAESGGDVIVSGAELVAGFARHDLIDEYRLYVHPVLIGQGNPFFKSPGDAVKLRLAETRSFGNGVVLLRYDVTRR